MFSIFRYFIMVISFIVKPFTDTYYTINAPPPPRSFLVGEQLESHTLKRGLLEKKTNAWADLKSSCHIYLPWGLTMFLVHICDTECHSRKYWINWFDWCMITKAKTVIGYIFSSCKHVSVFFEDFEFNAIFIPMNLEKICSQAKVDSKVF